MGAGNPRHVRRASGRAGVTCRTVGVSKLCHPGQARAAQWTGGSEDHDERRGGQLQYYLQCPAMTLIQQLLAELDREAPRTKRSLEQVPAGRDDWKPHDKSMPLGRLAGMIATMPAWIVLIVKQDELDLTPPGGGQWQLPTQPELVAAHDKSVAEARAALESIDDNLLFTT